MWIGELSRKGSQARQEHAQVIAQVERVMGGNPGCSMLDAQGEKGRESTYDIESTRQNRSVETVHCGAPRVRRLPVPRKVKPQVPEQRIRHLPAPGQVRPQHTRA